MSCDILKALSGSPNRVVLTLEPGVDHLETWDFTGCLDGSGQPEPIVAYTMFVTQPRAKNGMLRALPGNVHVVVECEQVRNGATMSVTGGAISVIGGAVLRIGDATNSVLKLTLRLDDTATKSLRVEVTATCIIGAGSA